MAALQEGKPARVVFGADFVGTDQDVADLSAPRPETRWCLLELPKEQLEALEAGRSFLFKGEQGSAGGALLCAATATFSLEFLENSNSQFVAALGGDGELCTIFGQCRGQLILKTAKVDAQRLRGLLAPHAFGRSSGFQPDAEALPPVTMETLEYEVAASPAELRAMLEAGPYVEHEGTWRLMPVALEREILDVAMTVVTAFGWDPKAVDAERLLQEVQQNLGEAGTSSVPSLAVLQKALGSIAAEPAGDAPDAAQAAPAALARPANDGGSLAATQLDSATASSSSVASAAAAGGEAAASSSQPGRVLSLDRAKMDRARLLQLLREPAAQVRERFQLPPPEQRAKRPRLGGTAASAAAGGGSGLPGRDSPLRIEELVSAFRELTCTEATTEAVLAIMDDRAYVNDFEGTVHALDPAALPEEPRERLSKLFELQTHWRPERISALMAPTMGGGQKVDPWLLKWTRAVHVELEPGTEVRMITKKFAGL